MAETVADEVADTLALAGVERAFGLPGGEVLHLLDALRRRGIEFTQFRHEAAAGLAAAVHGKLRGTAGLAVATLGPGAANLLAPLSSSLLDREPLLAISAQLPRGAAPSLTHQRLPLLDLFRPVAKFAAELGPAGHRLTAGAAVAAALREPMGPAYLALAAEDARAAPMLERPPAPPAAADRWTDAAAAAEELRRRLAAARRPLLIAGLGTHWDAAPALRRWIAGWNIPHGTTPKAKGILDELEPGFVGVFGGMAVDGLMLEALEKADLVIGFGLDPVEIDKSWHLRADLAWVLESPCATGWLPKGAMLVEHRALLAALAALPAPAGWGSPFAEPRRRRAEIRDGSRDTLSPARIVAATAAAAPPDTIVTTDVGSHKYLFGQFWPSRRPGAFWVSNGLSGMGYGIPAAIGAKLARPGQPVLAVVGDGGFAMTAAELETAARCGAAIVVLVIADGSLSLIRLAQESRGLPNYGVDFNALDSVRMAEAAGVEGLRAASPDELSDRVAAGLAAGRPVVIEVSIDPDLYRGIV